MNAWRPRLLPPLVCVTLLCVRGPLHAQDIRDVVRGHVREGLDKPPEDGETDKPRSDRPKADKPRSDRPKAEPKPAAPPQGAIVLTTDAPATKGPELPQRILGKNLRIDLRLGGGYQGWVPQQYPDVAVEAGSYYVWTFEVRAKILRWLSLRRGYYESSGLAGPRTEEAAVASKVGSYVPKAAWLLGVLGFPITKAWEPIIRYETRAFDTQAKPSQPVCVVTRDNEGDLSACPRSQAPLRMVSGFETFVLGVRYDKAREPTAVLAQRKEKLPPLSFGIGLMSYRKPYQVTIDGNTLNGYLFDGRFRGAGLYFGTEAGGGPDRLFIDADAQLGLGEVKLTSDLALNALAPEDWLIGYLQGDVVVGYYLPLVRGAPTLVFVPQVKGGGASFFFFKADQKQGEEDESATVNWDFLWSVNASLILSL